MLDRRQFVFAVAASVASVACARPARAAEVRVYKTPTCGCCTAWVDHMRTNGFTVNVTDMDDVTPIARKFGVPDDLRSCHTAEVGGYFVEGHVPAADVRKLLREAPDAAGIAVAGMPIGSPGMEQGGQRETYTTSIVAKDGSSRAFVEHSN